MLNFSQFQPFIIALVLGALIGFERTIAFRKEEDHESENFDMVGGVRTFSLICLFGCMASFIHSKINFDIMTVSFVGVLLLVSISYYISYSKQNEAGITTEITIFICFIIGIMVEKNYYILSAFISVIVALILHLKEYLDKMMLKITSADISAIIKFGIITFVILPFFDPEGALYIKDLGIEWFENYENISVIKLINPYNTWMMVVLISGISFTGYIAIKILGSKKGIGLTGFLGGLVSSTATTMTFSKRSKEEELLSVSFSLAVLLACSTMFPRILVEVLIVNHNLLSSLYIPMGMMAFAGFTFCFVLWKTTGSEQSEDVPLKNPFNIMPAIKFGLLYAFIVFFARLMGELAGDSGLYLVSVLSGLTDVDAITLTMSQIARDDPSKLGQATIAITLAAFSNTILKAGMAFSLGSPKLRKIILIGFSIIIVSGICGLVVLALI